MQLLTCFVRFLETHSVPLNHHSSSLNPIVHQPSPPSPHSPPSHSAPIIKASPANLRHRSAHRVKQSIALKLQLTALRSI
jgi:hypothetical protein